MRGGRRRESPPPARPPARRLACWAAAATSVALHALAVAALGCALFPPRRPAPPPTLYLSFEHRLPERVGVRWVFTCRAGFDPR